MEFEMLDTPQTALTLPERAAVALGSVKHRQEIIALVNQYADIGPAKNKEGRDQAHAAGMRLLKTRTGIRSSGKGAREDATAFAKAVKSEEDDLVALIDPEENRLFAIRDVWDQAVEDEKQAKIAANIKRVSGHKSNLEAIRNAPLGAVGRSSAEIGAIICELAHAIPGEEWEEFIEEAKAARLVSLDFLAKAETERLGIECAEESQRQERARIEADRAELEELRAAQAKAAEEAEKRAAIELKAARDKQADELYAERQEAMRIQGLENDKRRAAAEAENIRIRLERAEAVRLEAERAAKHEEQMTAIREAQAKIDARNAEIAASDLAKEIEAAHERKKAEHIANQERLRVEMAEADRRRAEATDETDAFDASHPISVAEMPSDERAWVADHCEAATLSDAADSIESDECWSADEELFNADSFGELLDMNDHLEVGNIVWCGTKVRPGTKELCDADDIIDMIGNRASDIGGEWADDYPDVSKEASSELDEFLAAWITKHCPPAFWTVKNVTQRIITAEDLT